MERVRYDASAMSAPLQVVLCTAPDRDVATRLARTLVEEGLAACVNVVPGVTSVYRWEGRVQQDAEVLLVVKTHPTRLAALEARVLELHPYDVPEFVVLAAAHASVAYLAWLAGATA